MDVRGRAILMPGKKMVLELEPQANAGQQPGTPPEPEVVIRQIADGTLLVHPSKATITARRIQMQICNIQRGFQLVVGANGGWTGEAQAKLLQWLLKSEQKRARTASASRSPCPALEDQRLALEDKKPDEQLVASSSPQAPVPMAVTVAHEVDDKKPDEQPPASPHSPTPGALISEDVALASDDGVEGQALMTQPDRTTHDSEKSVNSSSSSSASSSSYTSSPARKLYHSRANIRKAQAAIQDILPIVSGACVDCANSLKYVQELLDNAM
jgi:hypothetical protein